MASDDRLRGVYPKSALAVAVSTVLAGNQDARAQDNEDEIGLEEVVVTARKISENIQDVPQSIQAFSAEDIRRSGINGVDDYARFIPSMAYVSQTAGASKIVFRGVADAPQPFIAASSASIYLDEQPLTQGSQQPDVRMVDIERIEALSGPQATLYGDSSQSGTLRIVTNKPDPSKMESMFDLGIRTGSDSDTSYELSAMGNFPLVEDKFAVRLVGFTAKDGGYIDNVLGSSPRFGLSDNAAVVADDINEVTTNGARISARWFANDDWTVTGAYLYQKIKADGLNEYDPTLGDLKVVRFHDEPREDDWQQFAITLEGDLGFADFVSATAYFTRDIEYIQDRTTYASYFSTFCFYSAYYAGQVNYAAYCFAGASVYENDAVNFNTFVQENTRFTQEFRLAHSGSRWDWIAGLFYEHRTEKWNYETISPGYDSTLAFAYWDGNAYYGPLTNPTGSAWWNSADDTEWDQIALFGEATYRFDDRWALTVGGRFYDAEFNKRYLVERPNGRLDAASNPGGDPPGFSNPRGNDSGFLPKISLKSHIDDDKMVYALYSEGFRAGGSNRGRGDPSRVATPFSFDADKLKNIEFGAKTRWNKGRLQLNATVFSMKWEDYQTEFNDPSFNFDPPEPFQTVVGNAGDAGIDGLEVSVDALFSKRFSGGFNFSLLNAETDEDIDFCRFVSEQALRDECQATSAVVPKGSKLPLTADFKASAYMQYSFPVSIGAGGAEGFARFQYSFTGESLNQIQESTLADGPAPQFTQDPYEISDLKFGVSTEDWEANLFVNNLFDERAEIYVNPFYFDYFWGGARVTTIRPREFGLRYTRRF